MNDTSKHLIAFSHLLAKDHVAGSLNFRELQIIALVNAWSKTPLSVGGIAEALNISSPAISRHVQKLVSRGLLQRDAIDSDRRLVLLNVTAAGRALDERVKKHYATSAPAAAA